MVRAGPLCVSAHARVACSFADGERDFPVKEEDGAMANELHYSSLNARRYGRYGHLVGFLKGRATTTVSVNPPSIVGRRTGSVDVSVPDAKLTRKQRVVMLPSATLEAGLQVTTTDIIADGIVRVTLYNATDSPINGAARDWTAHLFSMIP